MERQIAEGRERKGVTDGKREGRKDRETDRRERESFKT